ncbi:cell number regulator 13-like [Miscanthus floridulus]|uniref:cell number regulator 13-like n=1 Tax=Miscanthus floridulus TaxID=154761 RepID=UPI003458F6A5
MKLVSQSQTATAYTYMASSWDRVGQAASVMQVTGVDALGLVNMIVQAAQTTRRNRDLCQQLAQHVLIVADLLRKLDIPVLRQHLETRRPLEQLDAALFRAYKLVRSCAQRQENTSQIYQMFTGAKVASKLRLAQEEIDRYINLIPMITLVAAVGARQATNEVHEDGSNNDAAPT